MSNSGLQQTSYLKRQLASLRTEKPERVDERMRELVYLSNILIEGTSVNGARFSQQDATIAATNTINLGLTYAIFVEPWLSETELLTEFLEHEPGLIKAFNIGYHLLMELAQRVEDALTAALEHEFILKKLNRDRVLAEEVQSVFSLYKSRRSTGRSSHKSLQLLAANLSMNFDPGTCANIAIIGDDFPRFPRSLTAGFKSGVRVDKSACFISEVEELDTLGASLETLSCRLLS